MDGIRKLPLVRIGRLLFHPFGQGIWFILSHFLDRIDRMSGIRKLPIVWSFLDNPLVLVKLPLVP
jgi:hypothetical protein